jgi:hypothetical protein
MDEVGCGGSAHCGECAKVAKFVSWATGCSLEELQDLGGFDCLEM